jgi:predicted RNase H-like nuclease (RuvC/YqgF family)
LYTFTYFDQIKAKQNEHRRILAVEEEHHHNIEDQVRKLELGNRELENENIETRENFIKLQSHSMKYNLTSLGNLSLIIFSKFL